MSISKVAWGLSIIGAAGIAWAETYNWTGAEDGFWTNRNNWAEGAVPGRYYTVAGGSMAVGKVGDTVIFGDGLKGNGVTTVDFSGVYSVSNLYTVGTNRYTYGTDAAQNVPIEPYGTFSAAETPETPAAKINALLQLSVEAMALEWGKDQVVVRNNSTEEFVIGPWGKCFKSPNSSGTAGEPAVRFEGSGDLRFDGEFVRKSWNMVAMFATGGKVTINAPTKLRRLDIYKSNTGSTAPLEIEITENGTIEPISCYNYLSSNERDVIISGAGVYKFGVGLRGGVGVICESSASKQFTLACKVENVFIGGNPPADFPNRIQARGTGTLRFLTTDNTIQGALVATNGNAAIFAGDTFGKAGTFGSFGDATFMLNSNATVRHLGAEEDVTDRAITIYPYKGAEGSAKIEQCGEGAFTVESAVTREESFPTAVLTLGGTSSAPATFAGSLDEGISLKKEGASAWTFNPKGDYNGTISVAGGYLGFGRSMTLASLKATSGTTDVFVPAGCTLTVNALTTDASKKINVLLADENAKMKIANGTAGETLTGVTLNGHVAVLDDNLCVTDKECESYIYMRAADGDWMDVTNWKWNFGPMNNPQKDVYIDAYGGDYTVRLAGATVTTTNLYIGNGSGTATLLVSNSILSVEGRTTSQSVLNLNEGGKLEAVDSTVRLKDHGNAQGEISNISSVKFNGGEFALRGASIFVNYGIPESARMSERTDNLNTQFNFNDGLLTFDDDAEFRLEQENNKTVFYHNVKPGAANKTMKIRFAGRSHPNFSFVPWVLSLGYGGGHAVIEFDSDYDKPVKNLWNQTYVGSGTGLSEILIKRGNYTFGTYDLFHIASCGADATSGAESLFVTGRVEVASGASLTVNAQAPLSTSYGGMGIGQGIAMQKARGNSYLRGELLIAGTYTQIYGGFYVGMGPCADGEVMQGDGVANVVTDATKAADANRLGAVVLGGFGGVGRYTLTGGAFSTLRDVYVGGVQSGDLPYEHKNKAFLDQQHDAIGALAVSGGTFTTAKSIILGRDGTGTIELTGEGVVKADSVTVGCSAGQAASCLKFTSDADGKCGTLVADRLVFAAGAKLCVDATAFPERKARAKLMTLGNAPEGWDGVETQLVNAAPEAVLQWTDGGKTLLYRIPRGGVIILR